MLDCRTTKLLREWGKPPLLTRRRRLTFLHQNLKSIPFHTHHSKIDGALDLTGNTQHNSPFHISLFRGSLASRVNGATNEYKSRTMLYVVLLCYPFRRSDDSLQTHRYKT